ncbi:hypothetical protein C8J56DRAFT_931630 [Mycena floridula]|nr:hypothetical protein C8J56DRAFT_945884 [Mycena floridula]KAJ7591719.1 hypothetical protein C8J56DRAFT_931630 [Mycena floridula]
MLVRNPIDAVKYGERLDRSRESDGQGQPPLEAEGPVWYPPTGVSRPLLPEPSNYRPNRPTGLPLPTGEASGGESEEVIMAAPEETHIIEEGPIISGTIEGETAASSTTPSVQLTTESGTGISPPSTTDGQAPATGAVGDVEQTDITMNDETLKSPVDSNKDF